MTYFRDVYKKRGKWWGETSKEQYLNIAKTYFNDYLLNSPNADTVVLNNMDIRSIVSDNKDDENKITKFFLFDLEIAVNQGDLIQWYGDNWLVIQKEKRSFEAYNKVLAVRCNFTLNWIDDFGVLQQIPAHLLGTMSSRVEDNFRIASDLMIMPQANKNLKVILPYYAIKSDQKFIINGEAWRVLERDLISVNGVLYMYLIEDLVDSYDDDTTLQIADKDRIGSSKIEIGLDTLNLQMGQSFTFNPILYKDGKVITDAQFVLTSNGDGYYIGISGNTIAGLALGSTEVRIASSENEDLFTTCVISVLASPYNTNVLQITGAETIRWGSSRVYTVLYNNGTTPVEIASSFELINNDNNIVSITSQESASCTITANAEGLVGPFKLRATTEYGIIEKDILVVSIWG